MTGTLLLKPTEFCRFLGQMPDNEKLKNVGSIIPLRHKVILHIIVNTLLECMKRLVVTDRTNLIHIRLSEVLILIAYVNRRIDELYLRFFIKRIENIVH